MYEKNYDKNLYSMYEEEVVKNGMANSEIKKLKLEIYVLKIDLIIISQFLYMNLYIH